MQGIIRLGDKITHGGEVLSCSMTIFFGDIGVARNHANRYKYSYIVKGNSVYKLSHLVAKHHCDKDSSFVCQQLLWERKWS